MKKIWVLLMLPFFVALSGIQSCSAKELIPFEMNGKWGYVDSELSIVFPAQWDFATYFRHGETAIVGIAQENGKIRNGLIDVEGRYLVPCEYQIHNGESESFFGGEDGYYFLYDELNGLCGYYDIKNRYFCEPKYSDVDISFRNDENIISVEDPETHFRAYIHAETEEVIGEFIYIETGPWYNGAAIAEGLDSQYIQYANGTRMAIPDEYIASHRISHGLVHVINRKNNKHGLMNLQGVIVSSRWYDQFFVDAMGDFYGEYMGKTELVCYHMNK